METKICPNCENETHLIEGVSKKNNKPYKGYKCDNCDKIVEWVNDKPKAPKIAQNKGNIAPSLEEASVLAAIRELRLLIQALAVLSGYTLRDLQDEFTKLKEKK